MLRHGLLLFGERCPIAGHIHQQGQYSLLPSEESTSDGSSLADTEFCL
jgi:hypothetical protein